MREYLEENRRNWDERTAIHLRSRFYDVEGWLREGRAPRRHEMEALGDVAGLTLLHLQCHFGLDTLAWARAGALVTGLDFSPTAMEAARDVADRAGLGDRSSFVCADVHDAVEALGGAQFDVVYVSLGALPWLPSVDRWAQQVGALLSPGGRFYLHEGHPLAQALGEGGPTVVATYFEEPEPFVDDDGSTYTDGKGPLVHSRNYQWNHSVGEIVTALVRHGLTLDALDEHDWTVWPKFDWMVPVGNGRWGTPAGRPRLPLSLTVLAHRPPSD